MPVGCSSGQPTGFFVGGAGDKVLRDFNDPNDLKDFKVFKVFKVSNALKYRRPCPPPTPTRKVQPDFNVGLNLKAVIRLLKSEKPNS